ncbi:TIGR02206 family membrane protein [Candidatus Poribacteria bacterium]|nr:TIGR02206 family membrane protein [Candidatus Poribacteria bacterium]
MPTSEFQFLGVPHVVALALTITLPAALSVLVRKADSSVLTNAVCYLLAGILIINEIGGWIYRAATVQSFSIFVQNHLPLHICGVALFVVVLALLCRNQILYEIGYFWGIVGTLNAVITPQLAVDFPHYRFFQYFIVHGGIVASGLFATWGLRMRPTFKGLLRSFLLANLYMVVIAGINLLLKSNYMFICDPPYTKSPFFFAPWPWYIPILDAVAFVLFCVVYSPFLIGDWLRSLSPKTITDKKN